MLKRELPPVLENPKDCVGAAVAVEPKPNAGLFCAAPNIPENKIIHQFLRILDGHFWANLKMMIFLLLFFFKGLCKKKLGKITGKKRTRSIRMIKKMDK